MERSFLPNTTYEVDNEQGGNSDGVSSQSRRTLGFFVDLGTLPSRKGRECGHFKIRDYVKEMKENDKNICWPFNFNDKNEELVPPMEASKARYWHCENCVYGNGVITCLEEIVGCKHGSTCSPNPTDNHLAIVPYHEQNALVQQERLKGKAPIVECPHSSSTDNSVSGHQQSVAKINSPERTEDRNHSSVGVETVESDADSERTVSENVVCKSHNRNLTGEGRRSLSKKRKPDQLAGHKIPQVLSSDPHSEKALKNFDERIAFNNAKQREQRSICSLLPDFSDQQRNEMRRRIEVFPWLQREIPGNSFIEKNHDLSRNGEGESVEREFFPLSSWKSGPGESSKRLNSSHENPFSDLSRNGKRELAEREFFPLSSRKSGPGGESSKRLNSCQGNPFSDLSRNGKGELVEREFFPLSSRKSGPGESSKRLNTSHGNPVSSLSQNADIRSAPSVPDQIFGRAVAQEKGKGPCTSAHDRSHWFQNSTIAHRDNPFRRGGVIPGKDKHKGVLGGIYSPGPGPRTNKGNEYEINGEQLQVGKTVRSRGEPVIDNRNKKRKKTKGNQDKTGQ